MEGGEHEVLEGADPVVLLQHRLGPQAVRSLGVAALFVHEECLVVFLHVIVLRECELRQL